MRPGVSVAISRRATSLASSHGPRTLVSSTASVSSSDILWARWASGMPALLTRMSTVAQRLRGLGDDRRDLLGVGDVEGDRLDSMPPLAPISSASSVEPVGPAGRHGHRRPGGGERLGEAASEARAGAGHEGDAPGEVVRRVGEREVRCHARRRSSSSPRPRPQSAAGQLLSPSQDRALSGRRRRSRRSGWLAASERSKRPSGSRPPSACG